MNMVPWLILDPVRYPGWDELILSHPGGTIFHSSAWAEVLQTTYGYTPLYFTAFNGGKIAGLIPVMEVKSLLTGKQGVSLPFSDYCDPITSRDVPFRYSLARVIDEGRKRRWRSVEIRGAQEPVRSFSSGYVGHVVDLNGNVEGTFQSFRESVQRNIKKASREGVEVGIFTSLDSVKEFCRLNRLTRREYGLPPQPSAFFKRVYERIIDRGLGFVALGSYQGKYIAGAVFFHFGRKAYYKYGASDRKFLGLRPINLVMWKAIQWYCERGFKSLCLGRTEPENKGLIQFKSGWASSEREINYCQYDLRINSFVSGSSKVTGFHNRIFRTVPLPILSRIGNILYRHVG